MRRIAAVVVLLLVVAGGAYYVLALYPQRAFRAQLDHAIAQASPGCAITYQSAHVSILNCWEVDGVTVVCAGPSTIHASIGELDLTDPSWDLPEAWQHAVDDPAGVAPDTVIPVAKDLSVKNLRVDAANFGPVSVGSLEIEGLRLYPWGPLRPGVPHLAELRALLEGLGGHPPDLARLTPLLKFEAAWVWAIGYTDEILSDGQFAAKLPATGVLPARQMTMSVHEGKISDDDRGMVGEADASGMSVADGIAATTIDTISESGIDLRRPIQALLSGQAIQAALLDGGSLKSVELHGLKTTYANVGQVTIDAFGVSNVAFAGGGPVSGQMQLSKLYIGRKELPGTADFLQSLGLDGMTIGLNSVLDSDLAHGRSSVHDTDLRIDELGELDLKADATGVTPGGTTANLAHATITYIDRSLVARALKARAAMTGEDAEVIRQSVIGMIRQQAITYIESPEIAAAAKAIEQFLTAPKSLTVTLAPPQPVSAAGFAALRTQTPAQMFQTLGVSVTAGD